MIIAPAACKWMHTYDSAAPRHVSALSNALHIGTVLNEPNTVRADSRSGIFSLSWILTGSGTYKDGEQAYALDDGVLVFRRPNSEGVLSLDAHTVHRRCFIHMHDSVARLFLHLMPELARFANVTQLPFSEDLFERFVSFMDTVESIGETDPLAILPALRDMLFCILRPKPDRLDGAVATAPQYIATLPPNTQLPEIAQRIGVPYGQFRKRFSLVHGVAPGQWRINWRVARAKQELAGGTPIQRVSERMEYADVFAFTHQFRDVAGITPKAYQLNHID